MNFGLLEISSLAYLVASFAFVAHLLRWFSRMDHVGAIALGFGFALHTASIVLRLLSLGLLPVTSFSEGVSFLAWLSVGIFIVVVGSNRLAALGAVVAPMAFALSAVGVLSGDSAAVVPASLRSHWLPVHVTLAFLGHAIFAVAFAVSLVYLLQENLLKQRRSGSLIQRLPSLEQLDRLNFRCLAWGFPLLTLGILTGGIWAVTAWGQFWSWQPRELISLVTWCIYGGLLLYRLTDGVRGRRAARMTIIGFSVFLVSYLSTILLPISGMHGGDFGS